MSLRLMRDYRLERFARAYNLALSANSYDKLILLYFGRKYDCFGLTNVGRRAFARRYKVSKM